MASDHIPSASVSSLTPYDTGDRCEPKVWVPTEAIAEARGLNIDPDSFGKVDFDDDEGHTVCVVYVERHADGTHMVHVEPMAGDDELSVELHLEPDTQHLGSDRDLAEIQWGPHGQDSR